MRVCTILFILALLLSGCGGGSTNEVAPFDAPVASNFILRTNASSQVSSEVNFTDLEGDIVAVSIVILDSGGTEVMAQKEDISDLVGGAKSGTIGSTMDFSYFSSGVYIIELFWL